MEKYKKEENLKQKGRNNRKFLRKIVTYGTCQIGENKAVTPHELNKKCSERGNK
jgi:hypothetical protein